MIKGPSHVSKTDHTIMVIPVLVTGIHLPACFGACRKVDPGHKARDDQFRWIGLDQWHAARS